MFLNNHTPHGDKYKCMTTERKEFIRKQAINAFELLKGFTPEQRELFSSSTKTAEELAGYILELTNDEATLKQQ